MPDSQLVNIVINGRPLTVPKGEMIIEAARRIGIEIPHFCYHPRLSKETGANCRMCLVEVSMPRRGPDGTVTLAKMPKPQTSCSLPADEGMVIETETPAIVEARRGILEFLLINHPLDCPICDRGGECPLQNNTLHYGPPTTRFVEEKRHLPKAYPLSQHVVLDRERCIHCARCTRFAADISGDAQLGFLKRGADMEVSAYHETEFTSLFSGNVIELCPVGALLSRDYRFRARPWDLATQKSICTECSNGCNIKLDHRAGKLVRVNARVNEVVNEEWTCDRGKFGMGHISSEDRIRRPLIREGDAFREATWEEALSLVEQRLREAGASTAFLGGSLSSNEDLYVLQRLWREVLGSPHLDHRMGPSFARNVDRIRVLGHTGVVRSISDLEKKRTIVVFGSDLAVEQPIVYLRVRKAWNRHDARVIEIQPASLRSPGHSNRVADFASVSARYDPAERVGAAWDLLRTAVEQRLVENSALPNMVVGKLDTAPTCSVISALSSILLEPPVAVLVGADAVRSMDMMDVLEPLGALAQALGDAWTIAVPASKVNEQGARDLGILPDTVPGGSPSATFGFNSHEILESAGKGNVSVLWVSGLDVAQEYHDPAFAARNLEQAPFVVFSGMHLHATARMANVVLPVCSVAECDGTYTNVEGRVQRFYKAYEPSLDVREEWRIASNLAARLGCPMAYVTWRDVLAEIAAKVPIHRGCTPDRLAGEGVLREEPVLTGATKP